jgi:hypothetical protein
VFLLNLDYWCTARIIIINQGGNLQNYIILLLSYQKFTTTSNATINPPAAIIADRTRGNKDKNRSNYRGKGKNYSRFKNKIYNNNREGLYKHKNSRKYSR